MKKPVPFRTLLFAGLYDFSVAHDLTLPRCQVAADDLVPHTINSIINRIKHVNETNLTDHKQYEVRHFKFWNLKMCIFLMQHYQNFAFLPSIPCPCPVIVDIFHWWKHGYALVCVTLFRKLDLCMTSSTP